MAQVPATGKARRLALRALARFGTAAWAAPQASERAALALRAGGRPAPPEAPEVLFLMPLVGRHHVGDWARVEANLAATLRSFQRQSAPGWRVLICGQDRPALPEDGRIGWLPFDTPVEGNDKWAKLAHLTAALGDHAPEQGYVMPFDADDLLAPGVVAEMHARRAAGGYLVARGYVYDAGAARLAVARPQNLIQPGQKAFWKLCGSCAAFRCDRADQQAQALVAAACEHEHRMFPHLAALSGRPLARLRDPAVLYLLNHGENFGARRGRVSFKRRFVERFALPPRETEAALADFDGML